MHITYLGKGRRNKGRREKRKKEKEGGKGGGEDGIRKDREKVEGNRERQMVGLFPSADSH